MQIQSKGSGKIYKILAILLSLLLIFEQSGFAQALPVPNPFVPDAFRPVHLRFLSYDPVSNNFQLLLDKGLSPQTKGLSPCPAFGGAEGTDPEVNTQGTVPNLELQATTKTPSQLLLYRPNPSQQLLLG